MQPNRERAGRNRTLTLTDAEAERYGGRLVNLSRAASLAEVRDRTIHQDMREAIAFLPDACVDLLFLDPPYNLDKVFDTSRFRRTSHTEYQDWFASWFSLLLRLLKPQATVYACCDWQSSPAVYSVLSRHLQIRNRITWEREKGRGALGNWKNCSEDIYFCTASDDYTFNADAVRLKRRVLAPYRDDAGKPKDWNEEEGYRLTAPSNIWTDITVPFWSMPENTDHPTQKPEKLVAKILLASTNAGDVVLDPFLGSGTTSVVARKLGRSYIGIEQEHTYCCLAEMRLDIARQDTCIQGYQDGIFWERNSTPMLKVERRPDAASLFSPEEFEDAV